MKLIVDETELPEELPIMLSGILSKHGIGNWVSAWAGNGKNLIKIPVEIVVGTVEPVLDEELPKGGDE